MAHRIVHVIPGSIADQCGISAGDQLLSINGEGIHDQIDYQFLLSNSKLILEVEQPDGVFEIHLEKDEDEPLGLAFESTLMSKPCRCKNHCVFCFIDQMPKGMRETLYVKDDDWRLSLMMGNYITLTNLSDREFSRIIARRASPLYLSIHATDGAVRAKMMGNPNASRIADQLNRLKEAGIAFHCQVVLCPGFNDGNILDDTLRTLSGLFPAAQSVAVVPVGLTKTRQGLAPVRPFTGESAEAVICQLEAWQRSFLKKLGTRFVFPSDEFYCLSGHALPEDEAYEGYLQIENGVGLLRCFEKEYSSAHAYLDERDVKPRRVLIATGVSFAPFLRKLTASMPVKGVQMEIRAVQNDFFGASVTVAGLLTGQDLLKALADAQADEILISQAMLRHEGDQFLDGMPRLALERALSIPVHAVDCDGAAFLYALEGSLF